MNRSSKRVVAVLAVAVMAVLLGGCSIGARVAKGAFDKAVKNAENALATVQAAPESAEPQTEENAEVAESATPAPEEETPSKTVAPKETSAPASEDSGGWSVDIPAEVPKFIHGHYQKDQAGKFSTDQGKVVSATFSDTTKDNALEYAKALKDSKFDMSTMDIGDDLTAVGTLKLDKETINVVCGYKNDDHSVSIVVTVAKN